MRQTQTIFSLRFWFQQLNRRLQGKHANLVALTTLTVDKNPFRASWACTQAHESDVGPGGNGERVNEGAAQDVKGAEGDECAGCSSVNGGGSKAGKTKGRGKSGRINSNNGGLHRAESRRDHWASQLCTPEWMLTVPHDLNGAGSAVGAGEASRESVPFSFSDKRFGWGVRFPFFLHGGTIWHTCWKGVGWLFLFVVFLLIGCVCFLCLEL